MSVKKSTEKKLLNSSKNVFKIKNEMTNQLVQLVGWGVIVINIIAVIYIIRSNILKKALRCLFPILLNFPAIGVTPFGEWSFKFFHFQLMGFGGALWNKESFLIVTFPIGAIWIFYKMGDWLREKEMENY